MYLILTATFFFISSHGDRHPDRGPGSPGGAALRPDAPQPQRAGLPGPLVPTGRRRRTYLQVGLLFRATATKASFANSIPR